MDVKKLLMPLYHTAKRQNLNLRTHYQGILFTPDEALKVWNEGRFLWGPVNWYLEDKQGDLIHYGRDIK